MRFQRTAPSSAYKVTLKNTNTFGRGDSRRVFRLVTFVCRIIRNHRNVSGICRWYRLNKTKLPRDFGSEETPCVSLPARRLKIFKFLRYINISFFSPSPHALRWIPATVAVAVVMTFGDKLRNKVAGEGGRESF